jgi:hypothetical protein
MTARTPIPRTFTAMLTDPQPLRGMPCPRGQWCLAKHSEVLSDRSPRWVWSHHGPFQVLPDIDSTCPQEVLFACDLCVNHLTALYDDLYRRVQTSPRARLWRRRIAVSPT